MNLTSLQLRVLVKLATPGRMTVDRLVDAVLPRKTDRAQRALYEPEIRLQIDLLTLHGLITCIEQAGERFCVAAPKVVRWLAKTRPHMSRRNRKKRHPFTLPVLTASLALAAGCTHAPSSPPVASAAPVVSRYNAEGTPPPDRMEQFYNPRTGNMVYRFCVGAECPKPTPKRPLQPRSVVTEINPDGSTEPVPQITTTAAPAKKKTATASVAKPAASKNDNGASLLKAPAAKTAANDTTAAAVTEPLNAQRAAVQGAPAPTAPASPPAKTAAAIGAAAAAAAAAAPTPSVKEAMAPRPVATPTAKPVPKVEEEAPVVVPTAEKPIRVPSSPSARATPLDDGVKMARNTAEPAGALSAMMAKSVPEKAVAASGAASSAEQFVATWASLWSAKKADAYFSLYAPDFWPTYGTLRDFAAWKNQRRNVMERQEVINVSIEVVKVTEGEGKAAVRFWQNYESPSFRSRVLKAVDLAKLDGEWKIRRERLIPVEPATASA